jgi:hypothetical protein
LPQIRFIRAVKLRCHWRWLFCNFLPMNAPSSNSKQKDKCIPMSAIALHYFTSSNAVLSSRFLTG